MSQNIYQVYTNNPITSNAPTDLMYFGQSPYSSGDDAAETFANFAAQFGGPYTASALTETNDTNITLTLGGTPATALLQPVSLTLGWTGELAVGRGGTGAATLTGLLTGNGASAISATAITEYNVLTGGTSNAPNNVAPSATSGVPLISQGASLQPVFGTAVVAGGGTGATSFTAYMPVVGGTSTTSALQSVSISGASTGYVLTYVSSSAIPTFQAIPTSMVPFTTVTGATQAMSTNNGYIANDSSAQVVFTLPTTSAVGDMLYVVGLSADGWRITYTTGQYIQIGNATSTTTSGSVTSNLASDGLQLICIVANTAWATAVAPQGNLTVA